MPNWPQEELRRIVTADDLHIAIRDSLGSKAVDRMEQVSDEQYPGSGSGPEVQEADR